MYRLHISENTKIDFICYTALLLCVFITPVFLMCFVWCCPSWMYCAHPTVRLIWLHQWTQSFEDHNREFLDIANLSHFPEFARIYFSYGLNNHLQSTFICDCPQGLIHLSGPLISVGEVEENPSPKHFFSCGYVSQAPVAAELGHSRISALPSLVV